MVFDYSGGGAFQPLRDYLFGGAVNSSSPTQGVGYTTGAGAVVTQATNKSTAVTINNVCGQITLNAASLGATTTVAFTVNNNTVSANDVVVVNIKSGATASSYQLNVGTVTNGTFTIELRNYTGGALAEALVLNFAVFNGSAS